MSDKLAEIHFSRDIDGNINGFIAVSPDRDGCWAFGDSQVQALVNLGDAVRAWDEARARPRLNMARHLRVGRVMP